MAELFIPVTALFAISSDVFPEFDVVPRVMLQPCFSGFLEVNTVDTCTVPTSTESITTAWTLTVTTR